MVETEKVPYDLQTTRCSRLQGTYQSFKLKYEEKKILHGAQVISVPDSTPDTNISFFGTVVIHSQRQWDGRLLIESVKQRKNTNKQTATNYTNLISVMPKPNVLFVVLSEGKKVIHLSWIQQRPVCFFFAANVFSAQRHKQWEYLQSK